MNELKFEVKYHKYKIMIYQICFSYLKNEFDTNDAVQETFINFYNKNKTFKTDLDEKRYLIRIAINVCKDIFRKRKMKPLLLNNFEIVDDKSTTTEENYQLLEEIDLLSNKLKEVIILKYYQGFEYSEISSILNVDEATIRKRHQRALEILKEKMEI